MSKEILFGCSWCHKEHRITYWDNEHKTPDGWWEIVNHREEWSSRRFHLCGVFCLYQFMKNYLGAEGWHMPEKEVHGE